MWQLSQCLLMTCAAFISGAVLYSYLIPLLFFHIDVRSVSPDRNPGSSNVIRSVGLVTGIVCMALDVLKAFIPVFVAVSFLGMRGLYLTPVVAAPVLGHAFSPIVRFRGGKAVSAAYGALLALFPLTLFVLVPALLMAFFRFAVVIRPDSLGVAVSMGAAGVIVTVLQPALWLKSAVLLISAVMIYRQLKNPDKEPFSIGVWRYNLRIRDRHIVLEKAGA